MQNEDSRLKSAISLIINAGYQVDAETLAFIKTLTQKNIEKIVKESIINLSHLSEKPIFLTKNILTSTTELLDNAERNLASHEPFGQTFIPYAKEIEKDVKILENQTSNIASNGNIDDYLSYFRSRFTQIQKILKERTDVKDAIQISSVLKSPLNSKIKTIGIVTEKLEKKDPCLLK